MASDFAAPDHVLALLAQAFPESQTTPAGVGRPSFLPDRDVAYRSLLDECICGCGGGGCIPQREYQRQRTDPLSQRDLPDMILFGVNGKCGYPLRDAIMERYTGLDGRDHKFFVDLRSSSIAVRLEWLPYKGWTRQIRTSSRRGGRGDLTLAKLATQVARRMSLFFEEMRDEVADPSYQRYRFQPGVIDLDHLELVALQRVCKYSYMPHFRVTAPFQSL